MPTPWYVYHSAKITKDHIIHFSHSNCASWNSSLSWNEITPKERLHLILIAETNLLYFEVLSLARFLYNFNYTCISTVLMSSLEQGKILVSKPLVNYLQYCVISCFLSETTCKELYSHHWKAQTSELRTHIQKSTLGKHFSCPQHSFGHNCQMHK